MLAKTKEDDAETNELGEVQVELTSVEASQDDDEVKEEQVEDSSDMKTGNGEGTGSKEEAPLSPSNCEHLKSTVLCCSEEGVLPAFCWIGVGAILGVLARMGLMQPSTFSSFEYMLGNFVGTAVLAYAHEYQTTFRMKSLYLGVGTGFCGSLTTFSSWQESAGELFFPPGFPTYTTGERAYLWFEIQIIGNCVNLIAWDFGKHLCSISCCKRDEEGKVVVPPPCAKSYQHIFDVCSVLLALLTFAVVAVLTAYEQTEILFSLCWGPLGAWFRWRLSPLNKISPNFPVGTFSANILGTACIAMAYAVGFTQETGSVSCTVLAGFAEGFCGALTTVSTFVSELKSLSRGSAYIYGVVSIVTAQLVFVVIVGGYVWSKDVTSESSTCW